MTKVLFVRHGESRANRERYFAGQLDAELTPEGVQQAKLTAKYIKENYEISKVYASDLQRAFETGKQIADLADVEIIANSNLREVYAGKWQGMNVNDIITTYPDDYDTWGSDFGNARCTEGETIKEVTRRFMSEVTKIAEANPDTTIVIASHANPIRAILGMVKTGSFDLMQSVPCPTNASVSELDYNNGKWTIQKLSIDRHLTDFKETLHNYA